MGYKWMDGLVRENLGSTVALHNPTISQTWLVTIGYFHFELARKSSGWNGPPVKFTSCKH